MNLSSISWIYWYLEVFLGSTKSDIDKGLTVKNIRILNTDHDSRQLGSFEIKWIYRFCDPPWAWSIIMVRTLYYTKLKELVSKTFV